MSHCIKCHSKVNVINHHISYKEKHGVEVCVPMCRSCHMKLHHKLRKNKVFGYTDNSEMLKASTKAANINYRGRHADRMDKIMDNYFEYLGDSE